MKNEEIIKKMSVRGLKILRKIGERELIEDEEISARERYAIVVLVEKIDIELQYRAGLKARERENGKQTES